MFLEKYVKELYRCNRCRQCRYVTEKPLALIDPTTGGPLDHVLTPSCPPGFLKKFTAYYSSGRLMIAKRIHEGLHKPDEKTAEIFYMCSLCSACDFECSINLTSSESPEDLEFRPSKLFEKIREELVNLGIGPMPAHRKFAESITKNYNPYLESHSDRMKWAEGRWKTPSKSDVIYFVGCTTAYRHPEIAKATVDILDKAGVSYGLLNLNEHCCGSPLLRTGQRKLAEEMMRHNVKAIKEAGAKTVISSCAGCYATLKKDYPQIFKDLDFQVLHTSEYLQELLKEGRLELKEVKRKVTYHDPCHLGRHAGLYDPPREILKSIPGIQFVEMLRQRRHAWCCGGGGGLISGFPEIASETADIRIQEALSTGADTLVSTCPFCKLNLVRAADKFKRKIDILDLTELIV